MTFRLLMEHFDELISTSEDVEKLNRSILDLAVRGRLTHRESGDEPIHYSLNQLRKAKKESASQLIESIDEPYKLPNGWEWERLAVVAMKTQDGTHYSPKVQHTKKEKNTYLYITSKNIKIDGLDLSNVTYIDEVIHRQINQRCNPEKGDVLLIKDGAMTGMVTINNLDEEFSLLSSVALIKTEKQILLPKYLMYFLRSPSGAEAVLGNMSGSAIRRIVMRKLDKTPVAVPPLAEQQRIVARVDELFAQTRLLSERLAQSRAELDRLNQSALAHLLASQTPEEFNDRWAFIAEHFDLYTTAPEHIAPLRQSILELVVRGKLTRREIEDEPVDFPKSDASKELFDLPEGWSWFKMHEIGKISGGITKNGQRNSLPLKMPYLRVANVYSNELRLDDVQEIGVEPSEIKRAQLEDRDLLVVEGNGSIEQIGRVAIWRGEVSSCLHQNHIIKVRFEEKKLVEFILYWLLSPSGRKQITNSAISTTGLHTLSLSKVSGLDIPLPPLSEQERIVKRVEGLLGWCDALEGRLRSAEEERGRLVESVLAGVGG